MIVELGRELLEEGLKKLRDWQQLPQCRNLTLSINLVADQIYEEGFAESLIKRIRELGIDPSLLMFEFTESTLIYNLELARVNIEKLNKIGVNFAIDDFGTGYSSLTYLSQLPWHQLKIDQSFVRNIGVESKDEAIIRTIISMAQSLGLEVIAEGVETASQKAFLLQHGCTHYQGYLFGYPVPASQFETERCA